VSAPAPFIVPLDCIDLLLLFKDWLPSLLQTGCAAEPRPARLRCGRHGHPGQRRCGPGCQKPTDGLVDDRKSRKSFSGGHSRLNSRAVALKSSSLHTERAGARMLRFPASVAAAHARSRVSVITYATSGISFSYRSLSVASLSSRL